MGIDSREELCDRYSKLYTGAITDALDDRGHFDQTMDERIDPLDPGMRMAGIAYPVKGRPAEDFDREANFRRLISMASEAPSNAAIVYETGGSRCSHIGEINVEALNAKGCSGAVIDGGARDVAQILDQPPDFPVFVRHTTPAYAISRWEILDWDVAAEVGGVRVSPDDVVVGDADGVVVIPADIAPDVLEDAEGIEEQENELRETVRQGLGIYEAFERHQMFDLDD